MLYSKWHKLSGECKGFPVSYLEKHLNSFDFSMKDLAEKMKNCAVCVSREPCEDHVLSLKK